MANAGQGASGYRGWQRRGEDKSGGKAADEIADRGRSRHIAADHAKGLCQCALDHSETMAQALAVGYAASLRAIQSHAMHFVEIGHSIIGVRHVTELRDRMISPSMEYTDSKGTSFGARGSRTDSLRSRSAIVVGKNARFAAAVPHALDHRGVIKFIGQDRAAWHVARPVYER